jgi:hypothetical protein
VKCRHCSCDLSLALVDLGSAPPSNAYLTLEALRTPEKWYPLRVLVCEQCWLVQTEDFAQADELFDADYAYFSGFSSSWLRHAKDYVAEMTQRFGLSAGSHFVEVAANDGYLLQYVKQLGIPCLGVEPTAGPAAAARAKGIPIVEEFFGVTLGHRLAQDGKRADMIAANNVLAHVPDINDFACGFKALLNERGVVTFEFQYLMRLLAENQFDTIYHEHFSYLTLTAAQRVLEQAGLDVFDVEALPTQGGSLRVFAQRSDTGQRERRPSVDALLQREAHEGVATPACYSGFQERAEKVKDDFLSFLLGAKRANKSVAGYGAAAKGNTLLNFAGVRPDLIPYVVDRNPAKAGKFMPGSRIPIVDAGQLEQTKPDYVVILPWNLRAEVTEQLSFIREWGGRFVTAVPALEETG